MTKIATPQPLAGLRVVEAILRDLGHDDTEIAAWKRNAVVA